MKNYVVKIQVIKEDIITIPATDRLDAIDKAEELINETNIKDLNIKNITNNYIMISCVKKQFIKGTQRIIKVSDSG